MLNDLRVFIQSGAHPMKNGGFAARRLLSCLFWQEPQYQLSPITSTPFGGV